ncbi:SDR family oxidoreductase [Mycolicibacterium smegmatis]|uniref:Short-chain dehydrogenase/reductase SDR n=4 Tax=Mycolicibacterium smegmatis TaxID=1772 RepID=I7FE17_MYCS2|nr:SDR family oxidoreductase [Mycolicibacterium smegmatis]ABK70786.1 short-chain dehydrogenase/reductase SDR [Mycolicibacterium smegmatis MC2 155]AFP39750.1 Short-chain dehydrogenase/reductase SDR [Mycolicibacterium smegmatis MC2 155]AIU08510.1 short-chain dehydrogenase [Mycolicibacterium smegmatis MC2 155]AIU15135.1 short-chain dehydrogenase [Mycolicibacterium smegmatis]AIU21758.1 short-chain dehydrogenase [Mycolicibacterium smegmatis]
MSHKRLAGKTALITGGTSGIGLATARLFAAEGAKVAVIGRDADRVQATQDELGDGSLALRADTTSPDDMTAVAGRIQDAFGGLDVFFANAGIAYPTPLLETDEQRYDEIMDINIKGVFFSMQAVAPILRDGASVILNTSFLNQVGRPGLSLLSASKAAVRSFARTWSAELLDRGIRVNAISPGAIDTPLQRRGRTPEEAQAVLAALVARTPAGRAGAADDIAQAALYLAGDESTFILGAELVVDGGISQL